MEAKKMSERTKREELDIEFVSDMVIHFDPECLHCMILAAMAQFANSTDGRMEVHHSIHSLIAVIDQITSNVTNSKDRKDLEDFTISEFRRLGFNWMRVEGGKQ
jgi:hypothetical protein